MPQGAIPFPFGDCRICNDKATGVHYGVATCEGCKGFFKRSLPKADKYKCFFGGQCQLSPQNRNRCKACRFKKCMDMGMSVDAVKMGRIPKVDKERALEENKSMTSPTSKGPPQNIESGDYMAALNSNAMQSGPSLSNSREYNAESPPHHNRVYQSPDGRSKSYIKELEEDGLQPGDQHNHHDNQSYHHHHPPGHPALSQPPYHDGENRTNSHHQPELAAAANGNNSQVVYRDGRSSNPDSGFSDSNHSDPESPHKQESSTFHFQQHQLQEGMDPRQLHQGQPQQRPQQMPGYDGGFEGQREVLQALANMKSEDDMRMHTDSPGGRLSNQTTPTPLQIPTSSTSQPYSQGFQPHLNMHRDSLHLAPRLRHNSETPPSPSGHSLRRSNSQSSLSNSSTPRPNSRSLLYSPGVMKELISQVIESGSGNTMQNNFIHPSMIPEQRQLMENMRNIIQSDFGEMSLYQQAERSPGGSIQPQQQQQQSIKRRYSDMDSQQWDSGNTALPSNNKISALDLNGLPRRNDQVAALIKQEIGTLFEQGNLRPNFQSQIQHVDQSVFNFGNDKGSMNNAFAFQNTKIKVEKDTSEYKSCDNQTRLYNHNPDTTSTYGFHQQQIPQHIGMVNHTGTADERNIKLNTNRMTGSSHIDSSSMYNSQTLIHSPRQQAEMEQSSSAVTQSGITDDSEDRDIIAAESKERCGDHLQMIQSTLTKMKDSEETQCLLLRQFISDMEDELAGVKPYHELNQLKQATYGQVKQVWNALFEGIPVTNKIVISICQDFPGFTKLDPGDQAQMLEESYFDIWLILHSALFRNGESFIKQINGTNYSNFWMKHFLPETLIVRMHKFSEELNQCKLSRLELNILCAIVLTDPERQNTSPKEEIRLLHSHYLDVLAYAIEKSHPTNHGRILINLFRIMPMLQAIQIEQTQVIGSFRPDKPPERCESMVVPGSMEEEQEKEMNEKEDMTSQPQEMGPEEMTNQAENVKEAVTENTAVPAAICSQAS